MACNQLHRVNRGASHDIANRPTRRGVMRCGSVTGSRPAKCTSGQESSSKRLSGINCDNQYISGALCGFAAKEKLRALDDVAVTSGGPKKYVGVKADKSLACQWHGGTTACEAWRVNVWLEVKSAAQYRNCQCGG